MQIQAGTKMYYLLAVHPLVGVEYNCAETCDMLQPPTANTLLDERNAGPDHR